MRTRRSTWLNLTAAAFVLVASARCSGGASQDPPEPTTSTVVGASGGAAASSDGLVTMAIPSGALPKSEAITIAAVAPRLAPAGALGTVYAIGPAGATLAEPATLTFDYSSLSLSASTAAGVRVAAYVSGAWQILGGYAHDGTAETISGTTTTLGADFALWSPTASNPSAVCVSFSGGEDCSGSSSTGGGISTSCSPSTCAEATDVCAPYPGSTFSCTDGAGGYEASCCFASGQACVQTTISEGCGGSSASGSSGGSGSGSGSGPIYCGTPPSCEASSPCDAYAGTTVQSCTDSTSGYTATCCYAPGAVPPPTTSGGTLSGGGSSGSSSGAVGSTGGSSGAGSSGSSSSSGG